MTVRYLALDEYLAIAVEVTGQQVETLINAAKTDLADSALHSPAASFSGEEFYPDFVDKAAVLIVRLAKNHPLPDGNKRAAWASLRLFLAYNDWVFDPYPSVDEAEAAVQASRLAPGTSKPPPTGSERDYGESLPELRPTPGWLRRTFCSRTPGPADLLPRAHIADSALALARLSLGVRDARLNDLYRLSATRVAARTSASPGAQ